jgi:hypothetical protein
VIIVSNFSVKPIFWARKHFKSLICWSILYMLHTCVHMLDARVHVQRVKRVCLDISKLLICWSRTLNNTTYVTHEYATYRHVQTQICIYICVYTYVYTCLTRLLLLYCQLPFTIQNGTDLSVSGSTCNLKYSLSICTILYCSKKFELFVLFQLSPH